MKILFVLKKNNAYGYNYDTAKSGLSNSAGLTATALHKSLCVDYKISVVQDANSIDKEVSNYKPDYCIIEALFVTPLKLQEIQMLHKKVIFIVRIHSKIAFLSGEGIAIEWIKQYVKMQNVSVCFNNKQTNDDFNEIGINSHYLPNIYYFNDDNKFQEQCTKKVVKIGCFGAIRPLKNQLFQAFCALEYARKNKVSLEFHINSGRQEEGGESALKNIRNLFEGTSYKLVEHTWHNRETFLKVIKNLDLGLQLSFTESFNIVAADFVYQKVPIIVSNEIEWMTDSLKVSTSDSDDVINKIERVLRRKRLYVRRQLNSLNSYNSDSLKAWKRFLKL